MSVSERSSDVVVLPKFNRQSKLLARQAVVTSLQAGGPKTLLQLSRKLTMGTRALSEVLAELVSDGVIYSEFVPGEFPRKVVYGIRTPAFNGEYQSSKPIKGYAKHGRIEMTIKFPPYLFEIIRREAVAERRSFAAQAVCMLESVLSTEGGM